MNSHEFSDTFKLKYKFILGETQILDNDEISTIDKIFINVVDSIVNGRYSFARELLMQAASEDIENPDIYNMLGISYEKEGDRAKAAKYYRVAYYMEQSFIAAKDNLQRVSEHNYRGFANINWGKPVKEEI